MNEPYDYLDKTLNEKEQRRNEEPVSKTVQEIKTQEEFDKWHEDEWRRLQDKFPNLVPAFYKSRTPPEHPKTLEEIDEQIAEDARRFKEKFPTIIPEYERIKQGLPPDNRPAFRKYMDMYQYHSDEEKAECLAHDMKEREMELAYRARVTQKDHLDNTSEKDGKYLAEKQKDQHLTDEIGLQISDTDVEYSNRHDDLDKLFGLPIDERAGTTQITRENRAKDDIER